MMPTLITERDEAAQAVRDLAEKLKPFPALSTSLRTLAGAAEEGDEVELGRKIAEHGKSRLALQGRLARRLRRDVDVLDVKVDPTAKLTITDDGVIKLDCDDYDAAAALAFAFHLEMDDTYVILGHCEEADLPIPYRHLSASWKRLAEAWEDEQADRADARYHQDAFERSQMGPL